MGLITVGCPCRDLRESDANGFVQKAISAANVYNNIVKYVDDANITSLTTLNLSKSSEEVNGIPKKTQKSMCSPRPHCLPLALNHWSLLFICFRRLHRSTSTSGSW